MKATSKLFPEIRRHSHATLHNSDAHGLWTEISFKAALSKLLNWSLGSKKSLRLGHLQVSLLFGTSTTKAYISPSIILVMNDLEAVDALAEVLLNLNETGKNINNDWQEQLRVAHLTCRHLVNPGGIWSP